MTGQPHLAVLAATSGHSGVDRNLKNLIPAIAAQGVRVDLLHIRKHGPYFERLPDGVRFIDLGTSHASTSLFAVIRYLRRERPDVLLADKDKVNRLALWARRLARVRTRVAVRLGINVSQNLATRGGIDRWVQLTSIRFFYPWADAVIVPSQGVATDLAAVGRLPRDRIHVLPNPVVTAELLTRAREPVTHAWLGEGKPPLILGVGELSSRKDFATLVRAFAKVRRQRPCRLMVLGRGRQHEALLKLAAELNVADDVVLPGFVTNPYAYMHRAAAFVLSSRIEGFGNVLVEALAAGAPVVATDCPSGPAEILGGGRYGLLVPVGDVAAMAAAIAETLDRPVATEVRREAIQPFMVENSMRRYLEALRITGDRSE
jgi:glycosyltransferase involved in cell wall biosynthesis